MSDKATSFQKIVRREEPDFEFLSQNRENRILGWSKVINIFIYLFKLIAVPYLYLNYKIEPLSISLGLSSSYLNIYLTKLFLISRNLSELPTEVHC
jgi:hypothetical protein